MTGCKSTWQRLQDAGVPIVPMSSLYDATVRNRLQSAQVIYGVDVNTHMGSVFYGSEKTPTGQCLFAEAPQQVMAIAIDFDSNELDSLAATTQELKGSCRYDFDRSVPCLMQGDNTPPSLQVH